MVKNPRAVWRISVPQVITEERRTYIGNSFPILHLEFSSGHESAGFQLGALALQKFLWFPKNVRIPKYSYLLALLEKHATDTWQIVKLLEIWTYLKANRIIHGTLHTLPKHPPSVDGGM